MVILGGGVAKKARKGRRKIQIKKIENQTNRHVTFSKRRLGVFKKASEACILTGAQIAIIVQSESHRLFSFGCPTEDAVFDRFLTGGTEDIPTAVVHGAEEYNWSYAEVCKELAVEKKKGAGGNGSNGGGMWWFGGGVEGKGVEEMEEYAAALDEFRRKVTNRADEYMLIRNSNLMPAAVRREAAPPMSSVVDDVPTFGDQDFYNDILSGFDQFAQGAYLN